MAAVTFACDEERLRAYLPRGATIDALEGSPRVSLVAFEFRRTRVGGLAIPGHIRFPEINLRFYVRYDGERGVVCIRELVPRRAIATVARVLYNVAHPTWAWREVTDLALDVDFVGSPITVSRPLPA